MYMYHNRWGRTELYKVPELRTKFGYGRFQYLQIALFYLELRPFTHLLTAVYVSHYGRNRGFSNVILRSIPRNQIIWDSTSGEYFAGIAGLFTKISETSLPNCSTFITARTLSIYNYNCDRDGACSSQCRTRSWIDYHNEIIGEWS